MNPPAPTKTAEANQPATQTAGAGAAAATPGAPPHSLVIAVVGSGGDGVALLGDLLLRMAARQGLYGIMVQSYGPQIRGGESAVVVRISDGEIQYEGDKADVLLCFRLRDIKRFQGAVRLHPKSVVILEKEDQGEMPEWLGRADVEPVRFPFARWEDGIEVEGPPKNMMGLGILCRVLGWPETLAREVVERRFARRKDRMIQNVESVASGYAATALPACPAPAGKGQGLFAETGNEAIARGAIASGIRFFAGYPITPSSEVMETLIDELPQAGGRVVQAEDEIAAMGMVLGASFGGTPAMTATSGPGLSLMTEMIGLSSMSELPAVIVDCQRAGPATGMPSRTEQADLYHAVYGGHGDFPRAVLGAFDVVHAREVMYKAVLLSEKYQLPVLVLSDGYIAQRRQIRDPLPESPPPPVRTVWTENGPSRFDLDGEHGVNPFRVPGTPGGTYLAAGLEHTADGNPTADTATHQRMNEKRFRKLPAIADETRDWYRTLGASAAPQGIVAWGSQYGILREWVMSHPEYRVFLPEAIHPFPLEGFEAWRRGLETLRVLELSYQGQFLRYLSSITDLRGAISVARSGGVPLTTTELQQLLTEVKR